MNASLAFVVISWGLLSFEELESEIIVVLSFEILLSCFEARFEFDEVYCRFINSRRYFSAKFAVEARDWPQCSLSHHHCKTAKCLKTSPQG